MFSRPVRPTAIGVLCSLWIASQVAAQQNAFIDGMNIGTPPGGPAAVGPGNQVGTGQGPNAAFPGGAANADFDSLIELITSTVAVDSWVDNGGTSDIRPFPTGVWVDPTGVLRNASAPATGQKTPTRPPAPRVVEAEKDARQSADLRCVSLPRLEAEIYRRMRDGKPLDEAMLTLAGLQRVEFVFVYPEVGDVVLAGPAGDWHLDDEQRLVSTDTGGAVVRLDDLVTLLRRERRLAGKPFGCSINPRQENLAATQTFLDRSAARPLPAGRAARQRWLGELQQTLGRQDIEVFGLDGSNHAAHVLVKADHHMKQIGIGLADGVPGVDSYLDTVVRNGGARQPLNVLRWWFAANYQGVVGNQSGTAFELRGQGVRVLSENEMLTERGERIHTGQADEATKLFAEQFTGEFAALAARYPVYAELRNLFDLAIVAALLESTDLYASAGWDPVLLLDDQRLPLPDYHVPREVDTILNHRMASRTQILAAVSGGVMVDSRQVIRTGSAAASPQAAELGERREQGLAQPGVGQWWWDVR